MRFLILIACNILLLSCSFNVWSQSNNIFETINKLNGLHLPGEIISIQEQTVGSQYFMPNWSLGSITLMNGDIAKDILLNYNGLHDQLHAINPSIGKPIVVDKNVVVEFSIYNNSNGEDYIFRKIMVKSASSNPAEIYGQILTSGKYTLIAHRNIVINGKELVHQNGKLTELPRIRPKYRYYIIKNSGEVKPIEIKKNQF